MKRHHRIVPTLALAALAACTTANRPASEAARATADSAGQEMSREALLASSTRGDAAAGAVAFEVCGGCHRDGGSGRSNGSYPRIAGQHATVLLKQLYDIRSGRRQNHRMKPFTDPELLGPQQLADVAAYLQAQPVTPDNGKGPGTDLTRGQALYGRDCARCHGQRGEGQAADFVPRLAGQHYMYLLREARTIRDGGRGNSDPAMVEKIRGYPEADLEAVSDFASRLAVD